MVQSASWLDVSGCFWCCWASSITAFAMLVLQLILSSMTTNRKIYSSIQSGQRGFSQVFLSFDKVHWLKMKTRKLPNCGHTWYVWCLRPSSPLRGCGRCLSKSSWSSSVIRSSWNSVQLIIIRLEEDYNRDQGREEKLF